MNPALSIVIPLYNEEDNVLALAREVSAAVKDCGCSHELLLVDDGSRDNTWGRIADAAAENPSVRGLRHKTNAGQSAAVWTGLQAARGEILATLDGDLQNDPAEIPRMMRALGEVEFVCGMRVKRQDNWIRRISSLVARTARKLALGVGFEDTGCALRVFRREVLAAFFPFDGLHRFLPILAATAGFRTREVPVNHRPRLHGVSKYGVWKRLWRGIFDLCAMAWYQRRRLRPVQVIELGVGDGLEPRQPTRR